MRFRCGVLSALALGVAWSPAIAADLPVKARPVVPVVEVFNWTGFYIGGNAGYSWGRNDFDLAGTSTTRTQVFRAFGLPAQTQISDVSTAAAIVGNGRADVNGGVAGGQIGYNWQLDRTWVFGLETDLQWSGQKGSVQFCLLAGCPAGGFTTNVDYGLRWF